MTRKGIIVIPDEHKHADTIIRTLKREFDREFGGHSAYDGTGGWVMDDGEHVRESHTRLEFVGEFDDDYIHDKATFVEEALDQESVMYEIQETDVRFT